MTIDTARTLATRHGGQIEREIMWLISELERLQQENDRLREEIDERDHSNPLG
jgi:regulator of replication initiation timing